MSTMLGVPGENNAFVEDGAAPAATGESAWTKLGGEELEGAIRDGLVKCLDSRHLVERAHRGEPLVRRQDMPEDAYVGLDKLKAISTYSKEIFEGSRRVLYQWLPLMIVSYAWLSPKHPDPFGETLKVLAEAVQGMELHGVIIDFTALPQVSKFPAGYPQSRSYDLPSGYKPVHYKGRGWCFAEAAMAGLGKSPKLVCDVSHLSPVDHVIGGSVVRPQPPLPPKTFNNQLRTKKFTQPRADAARVQALYSSTFHKRVLAAQALQYSAVGWHANAIALFALAITKNEQAETLELSGNEVGEKGMKALGKVLRAHRALKTLELAYCELGPGGACELGKVLRLNTVIARLNLDNALEAEFVSVWQRLRHWAWRRSLEAISTGYIAEALKVNNALTELNLRANKIEAQGAQALMEALKVNTSLTQLDLSSNSIGNEGAQALAEALKVNSALTQLSLPNNRVGNEGAQALAEALKVNTTLTQLNLYHNSMEKEGAQALAEALRVNTTLTQLILGMNGFGTEGEQALAEANNIHPHRPVHMADME